MSGKRRRRKSGNHGHRLQQTAAPSGEIAARQRKARKPKPVTVRHADGRVEVKPASAFEKSRRMRRRRRRRQPALPAMPALGATGATPGQVAVIHTLIRQLRPTRLPRRPRDCQEADRLIDRLLEDFAGT